MIKEYCDVCGKEVNENRVCERIKRELGTVRIEVMVAIDKTWNCGAICEKCLIDVIKRGQRFNN